MKFKIIKPIIMAPVRVGEKYHRTKLSHGSGIYDLKMVESSDQFIQFEMEFINPHTGELVLGVVELLRDCIELIDNCNRPS